MSEEYPIWKAPSGLNRRIVVRDDTVEVSVKTDDRSRGIVFTIEEWREIVEATMAVWLPPWFDRDVKMDDLFPVLGRVSKPVATPEEWDRALSGYYEHLAENGGRR